MFKDFEVEKKQLAAIGAIALVMLMGIALPFVAGAQGGVPTALPELEYAKTGGDVKGGVTTLVQNIANVAGTVIMGLSILMILWSAFQFLTAGANPDNVGKARTTLVFALVGVAVALLAFALPAIVARIFK